MDLQVSPETFNSGAYNVVSSFLAVRWDFSPSIPYLISKARLITCHLATN